MLIGELASRVGVSVQAVRLYEQRGLMRAVDRTAAGYRVYQPLDLEILTIIKRCQGLGLTLAETKRVTRILMDATPVDATGATGNSNRCLREIEAIGIAKLATMDAEIRELTATRDALGRTLDQIRSGMNGSVSGAIDPVPR